MLEMVTSWVENKPEHETAPSMFDVTPEQVRAPSIGIWWLVEMSRAHCRLDGNLTLMILLAGIVFVG